MISIYSPHDAIFFDLNDMVHVILATLVVRFAPRAEPRRRPLASFNKVQAFVLDINFKPRSFNPILTNKTLALSYPTERSLINVYSLAHDRNLEHMMENDDELPDVDSCMIPFSQSSRSLAKQASSQELKSLSKSSSLNSLEDSHSDTFEDEDDGPEPDINILGEAVLSKEKNPRVNIGLLV